MLEYPIETNVTHMRKPGRLAKARSSRLFGLARGKEVPDGGLKLILAGACGTPPGPSLGHIPPPKSVWHQASDYDFLQK